jgi:hypothetical protein
MAKRTSSTRRPKRARRQVSRRASKNRAPRRRRRAAVRPEKRRRARPTRRAKASPKTRRKTRPAKRPPRRAPVWAAPASPAHTEKPPTLARERRRLPDEERVDEARVDPRLVAEARSGHDAVAASLKRHHESSPELTAGDVDAKWDDAYAIGDEAPGGDNPTPDQNEVDAIGRAIGAEYADDEELMGGDEIGARDAHRWELDPQSRDDTEDGDEK